MKFNDFEVKRVNCKWSVRFEGQIEYFDTLDDADAFISKFSKFLETYESEFTDDFVSADDDAVVVGDAACVIIL
uniref:Uncharacterized protein n=1 Tax=Dulem virus 169 TaxID=3145646 RepID=A0AAU8AU33_9VIRU